MPVKRSDTCVVKSPMLLIYISVLTECLLFNQMTCSELTVVVTYDQLFISNKLLCAFYAVGMLMTAEADL